MEVYLGVGVAVARIAPARAMKEALNCMLKLLSSSRVAAELRETESRGVFYTF